jgi:hypothetical protein
MDESVELASANLSQSGTPSRQQSSQILASPSRSALNSSQVQDITMRDFTEMHGMRRSVTGANDLKKFGTPIKSQPEFDEPVELEFGLDDSLAEFNESSLDVEVVRRENSRESDVTLIRELQRAMGSPAATKQSDNILSDRDLSLDFSLEQADLNFGPPGGGNLSSNFELAGDYDIPNDLHSEFNNVPLSMDDNNDGNQVEQDDEYGTQAVITVKPKVKVAKKSASHSHKRKLAIDSVTELTSDVVSSNLRNTSDITVQVHYFSSKLHD